jgi:hypothetical protein
LHLLVVDQQSGRKNRVSGLYPAGGGESSAVDSTRVYKARSLQYEASVARQAQKIPRSGPQQALLVDELKALAVRLGFEVREEKLLRDVGYRVRSGSCRVRDAQVIFLDRGLPPAVQIDILVEELAGRPLDDVYVSPAARGLLDRAAAGVTPDQSAA